MRAPARSPRRDNVCKQGPYAPRGFGLNHLPERGRTVGVDDFPRAAHDFTHHIGAHEPAVVGECGVGTGQLQGRDCHPLPEADRRQPDPGPLPERRENPAYFSGQINAGFLSEPEGPQVVIVALFPQHLANFRRANIARFGQDPINAEFAVGMHVVDGMPANPVGSVLAKNGVGFSDLFGIQGGGNQ